MINLDPPFAIQPEQLAQHLNDPALRLIDVSSLDNYRAAHLPGALHIDYADLVRNQPPARGLLPDPEHLTRLFSMAGIGDNSFVVAYDRDGGGRASRLLWTLDIFGWRHYAILDGGTQAWDTAGLPVTSDVPTVPLTPFPGKLGPTGHVDKAYILAHLDDPDMVLLDVRSPEEYHGRINRAVYPGHIKGAVNWEWRRAVDENNAGRFRPLARIKAELASLGVTEDKHIVTYCHTHHRSAHTYIVLKILGFPRISGYPGSWSEWGSLDGLPRETDA